MSESTDNSLHHHGVKGMKWGVRKDNVSSGKGWRINADGSIDISKGATLQRVVRGHAGLFGGAGTDFGVKNAMYASFTPSDNAAYEYFFGRRKSLTVKEASRVLSFEAQTSLKSPSPKEAAKTYFEMLSNNPKQVEAMNSSLTFLARRQLAKGMANPEAKSSQGIYSIMYDMGNYNPKAAGVNDKFIESLSAKGYNMLLDSSDAMSEFQAPVVIFNATGNVQLKSERVVDRMSQQTIRQVYMDEEKLARGKNIMTNLGYV